MQKLLAVLVLTVTLVCLEADADDFTRSWNNGYVVVVTEVHTKPGQYYAYLENLNRIWRRYIEAQVTDEGGVVGYNVYINTARRQARHLPKRRVPLVGRVRQSARILRARDPRAARQHRQRVRGVVAARRIANDRQRLRASTAGIRGG